MGFTVISPEYCTPCSREQLRGPFARLGLFCEDQMRNNIISIKKHYKVLYESGGTIPQIAYIMGTETDDVRYHLEKMGLYYPVKKV